MHKLTTTTTTMATVGNEKVKVPKGISGFFGHAGWSLSLSLVSAMKGKGKAEEGDKKKMVEPSGSIRLNRLHPKPTASYPRKPPPVPYDPPTVETKGEIYRGMPVRGSYGV